MYIGSARNLKDVERAIDLATKTFRSSENLDIATANKKFILSPIGNVSAQDVVVLVDEDNEVLGTCFLFDRLFYRGESRLKGTFLSSICVAERSRGRGLSKLIMNYAIDECGRRDSAFAILIARRAVDYFYNKFNFWGLSQYSTIKINLNNIPAPLNGLGVSVNTATEDDLFVINCLYESTYSAQLGSCERSMEYWKYVLLKARFQNNEFLVFKIQDVVCGYIIFSGSEVYEIASKANLSYLNLLQHLGESYSLTNINININSSSQHPIVDEFHLVDFTVIQRQCVYGGHMVRIINSDILLKILEKELHDFFTKINSKGYFEVTEDYEINFTEGKVSVTLNSSAFGYKNTFNLMNVSYLSTTQSALSILKPNSFNISIIDQC